MRDFIPHPVFLGSPLYLYKAKRYIFLALYKNIRRTLKNIGRIKITPDKMYEICFYVSLLDVYSNHHYSSIY